MASAQKTTQQQLVREVANFNIASKQGIAGSRNGFLVPI